MKATLIVGRMWFKNFGPYLGEHEFDWNRQPGVYYIQALNLQNPGQGPNGCGKTMLFTALYWGLTGRTLRNVRPGDRVEPWLGAEGESTSVDVEFWRNGIEHRVQRSRHPNKLLLDGEVVTDADILKILGVHPEVMLVTFFIGQTNDLFLDMKPEPQSQFFTELLDLDQWLSAAEAAGKRASALSFLITDTKQSLDRAEGRRLETEEQLKGYREAVERFDEQAEGRLVAAEKMLAELTTREAALAKAFDKLPLPADLTEETERRDAAAARVTGLESSKRELAREVDRSATKLAEKEKALKTVSDGGKCPECGQPLKVAERTTKTKQLQADIAALGKQLRADETALKAFTSDIATWNERLESRQAALVEARRKTASLEPERQEAARVLQQVRTNQATTRVHVQEAKNVKNPYLEQVEEGEKRLKNTVERIEGLTANLADDETELAEAKFWQNAYREIRLGIIEDTLAEVSVTSNKHVERLGLSDWTLEFTTEKETKKGTVSHSFTALLYPPNIDTAQPWDCYSGGESTRLKLAVSFGLGEVLLSKIGFTPNIEVLDEASKGLSEEGITDLLACLEERSRETGRAIYLIDHHVISKGAFRGVITVEKRASGSSISE